MPHPPPPTAATPPVAAVRNVSKSFGPTRALNGVSIDFHACRVHCILGENGAGKSTVGKILGGLYGPDEGEVLIDGSPVALRGTAQARRHGVAMVFQELSLIPHLTVRENICLGMERRRHPLARLRRRDEEALCRTLLDRFGLAFALDAPVRTLSVANQQLLEVVKGLAQQPRLLILDEPTAMLGVAEKEKLLAIIRRVKADGAAVIFVTHHVDEVVEVADQVSLMKDGRLVDSFALTPEIDAEFVIAKLTGEHRAAVATARVARPGAEIIRFEGLPARRGRLASISVRQGEIVGLYGVVGCGRERMARAVVGLGEMGEAGISRRGAAHRPRNPAAAARLGIAYLPSGRAANGILPNRSIRENLMLTQLGRHHKAGVLSDAAERRRTEGQLARMRTRYRTADDPITSLSGGNQQKVILGRCLERGAELVVLEDPTAGVDIAAKRDIHDLIRERAAEGLGVLLVSSDLAETIALCDAVYTIIDGHIVNVYSPPTLDDEPAIVADVLGRKPAADDDPPSAASA
ncbi:sugar ABC transporter ATP-binding protein [Azospirillum sp. ST 5-10]|uniref:sugar ABC transporter ATP-binding protein n=1 Tax=unclassified Azospirillum TaxID=2630922 RepID=UPI003F49DF8C